MSRGEPEKRTTPAKTGGPTPSNRLALDYELEAARLGPPPRPIIDAHAHINGPHAAAIWQRAASSYGVVRVYSQTQLADAPRVRAVLGDAIEFIAIPEYMSENREHAFTKGFVANLDRWHGEFGSRCVKFWAAPRLRDFAETMSDPEAIIPIDGAWRRRVADRAVELGMMLMAHIADPDTWFATKYKDAARYGTKAGQYEGLERMIEAYPVPWLLAHMGGWPEDLNFLSGLLERHPRAVLDTSATKWMVRELSRHPRADLLAFLQRYRGRILFGSDIVTSDEHLRPTDPASERFGVHLASSQHEAFELYASRYWALRTLFETGYDGESPIADPDLAMVDPDRFDAMSAPRLIGKALPPDLLGVLYHDAATATLQAWFDADRA